MQELQQKRSNPTQKMQLRLYQLLGQKTLLLIKKSGRVWKASEIGKMKPWEFEKLEKELDEARAEGRIDYNN